MKNNNWRHRYPRLIIVVVSVHKLCSQPTEYFNWFLSVKRQLLICTTSYVSRTQLGKAINELSTLLTKTLAANAIQVLGRDFCTWAVFLQLASKVDMLLHPVALTFSIRVVCRDWSRSWAAEQNSCRNNIGFSMLVRNFEAIPTFNIVDGPGFLGLRRHVFRLEFQGEFCVRHHSRGVVTVVERSVLRLRMSSLMRFENLLGQD